MPDNETLVSWHHIDVHFKRDASSTAIFLAINPPDAVADDYLSLSSAAMEDGIERRLHSWGWTPNRDWAAGHLTEIGVYEDRTYFAHDIRFMRRIAPFVEPGSRAIFETDESPQLLGWDFDGTTVTLRNVIQIVDYEWDAA